MCEKQGVMKSRKGGLADRDAWKKRKGPTTIPTEGKAAAREKEKRGKNETELEGDKK